MTVHHIIIFWRVAMVGHQFYTMEMKGNLFMFFSGHKAKTDQALKVKKAYREAIIFISTSDIMKSNYPGEINNETIPIYITGKGPFYVIFELYFYPHSPFFAVFVVSFSQLNLTILFLTLATTIVCLHPFGRHNWCSFSPLMTVVATFFYVTFFLFTSEMICNHHRFKKKTDLIKETLRV